MKYMKAALLGLALPLAIPAMGEGCEIAIGISQSILEGDNVPPAIERKLEAKLKTALATNGVAAGDYDCQFFIAGRFDEAYSQEASGMGGRVMVKTDLQLAICDGEAKKVYAVATFPLKGVGATDEQALTKALTSLNTRNPEFVGFVDKAKAKIVDYFDNNYPTYISKAKRAMSQHDFDEALYWSSSVPECCKGFQEANALTTSIFTQKIDFEGEQALAKARQAWAANPNASGASEANSYLASIDPSSRAYKGAQELVKSMGSSVKADQDFETKEKYRQSVDLEKRRIESARQIGVAWAKNRPKTIVRNNWIVW